MDGTFSSGGEEHQISMWLDYTASCPSFTSSGLIGHGAIYDPDGSTQEPTSQGDGCERGNPALQPATEAEGVRTEQLRAGPWAVVATPDATRVRVVDGAIHVPTNPGPALNVSVECVFQGGTVTPGAGPTLGGVRSTPQLGVAVIAPTTMSYAVPPGQLVALCTRITFDKGGRAYEQYLDADNDAGNGVQCALVVPQG
jgi:hypothetical protein